MPGNLIEGIGDAIFMATDGTVAIGSTPQQFREYIVTETHRWRKLVQETGIRLGD